MKAIKNKIGIVYFKATSREAMLGYIIMVVDLFIIIHGSQIG